MFEKSLLDQIEGRQWQQTILTVHEQEQTILTVHEHGQTIFTVHEQVQTIITVHEQEQTILTVHEQEQTIITVHEQEQTILVVQEREQTILIVHEQEQTISKFYKWEWITMQYAYFQGVMSIIKYEVSLIIKCLKDVSISFVYISISCHDKKWVQHKHTSWVAWWTHDWGHEIIVNDSQLVFSHHASNIDVVTLSSNTSLNWYLPPWVGIHIKASWCCWRGYHWFGIHSTEHKVVSFKHLNTIWAWLRNGW